MRMRKMTDKNKIIGELMNALLDQRDFMGYQLSYDEGCMNRSDFIKVCEKYLKKNTMSDEELIERAKIAKELLGDKLDCDNLSIMLKCDVEKAMRIMEKTK
jgi:hypothetical protein